MANTNIPSTPASKPAGDVPLHDWRKLHAFGLPAGSVRAVLGLMIFGSIWVWIVRYPSLEVPEYLQNLMFIILGHYFAARKTGQSYDEFGPPPLFLPRGSIRFLMLAGFIAVPILLHRRGELLVPNEDGSKQLHRGMVTLFLVAGFLLGVIVQTVQSWIIGKDRPPKRFVEDIRAAFSLTAALLFVLLLFNIVAMKDYAWLDRLETLAGKNGLRGVLCAFVGFYFGSRS